MRIGYIISDPSGVWGGVRIVVEHLNRLSDRGHECWLIITRGQPMRWLPFRFNQAQLAALPISPASFDAIVGTDIESWKEAASDRYGPARRFALVQMLEHLFRRDGLTEERKAIYSLPLQPLVIAEWLRAGLAEFNPRPAVLVRNGLDPEQFFPDPFPEIDAYGHQWPPRLLVVGHSQNEAKDVDELAWRAIQKVRATTGVRLEAWGFSQFAPRWPYERYWVLPSQDTIRRIYSSCRILVIATRYEGDPGPDYEAMACGAVVCRAIDQGGENLIDGVNCLRVPYGDLDGLAANLRRLVMDEALIEDLSRNGRRYVAENRRWESTILTLEAALAGKPIP